MKQNDIKSLIDSIKQNRKRVGKSINKSDIVETKIYPEYKHCKMANLVNVRETI